jgi:uncharacterized membrane protein
LATIQSGLYKVLFLGHMVAFLVAFAPAVVNPVLAARAEKDGPEVLRTVSGYQALNGKQIHFPALIVQGALGLALVIVGDPVWAFDQAWVSVSFLIWFAMCGVVSGMILPSERKVAAGDDSAASKVALGGQIVTVLLLIMLYLMIWKPGV